MSATATVAMADDFLLKQCPCCGCWFAVPAERMEWYHRGIGDAKFLYCPNGHSFYRTTPDKNWSHKGQRDNQQIIIQAVIPAPTAAPVAEERGFYCKRCKRGFATQRGLKAHQNRWCK